MLRSCSDSGSVEMALPDENKQVTINFNEQLKKICIEKGTPSSGRKERSFIVGSASGRLTYHRTAWFSHKDIVLFAGSGSEVCSIAWKGKNGNICAALHFIVHLLSSFTLTTYF